MTEILISSKSDQPKRILVYTDCPGIYGVSQWNHSLIMKLVDLDYDVSCAQCQDSNYLIEQRNQRGIQHFWLKDDNLYLPSSPAKAVANTSEFETLFALAKPDLIVFSDGCPVSNIVAKKVAIQRGISYITIIHCVTNSWVKKFIAYLHYLPEIYQQSQGIFTVSQENLDLLHQKFKLTPNLGRVIYNGRPKQYFEPPNLQVRDRLRQYFNIPPNAVVCFTAARMDFSKGYQYQIKAIEQLKNSKIWSQLYFIWAGTGNLLTQLQTIATELAVSDHIKFVGERSDIPDLLDAADIFILPSQFEGMPLAIMEAMAKGKPIIASAVSGVPEQLGNTGKLLSDPKLDPEATIQELVIIIKTLTADAELRYSIGENSKNRAKKLFTEERMLKDYVTIINNILTKNNN
jgi:glycosyltransferase involved in cell wall biosynthesis